MQCLDPYIQATRGTLKLAHRRGKATQAHGSVPIAGRVREGGREGSVLKVNALDPEGWETANDECFK